MSSKSTTTVTSSSNASTVEQPLQPIFLFNPVNPILHLTQPSTDCHLFGGMSTIGQSTFGLGTSDETVFSSRSVAVSDNPSGSGFTGFGTTCASSSSISFRQNPFSSSSNIFGNSATIPNINQSTVIKIEPTTVEFNPLIGIDEIIVNNAKVTVSTHHQCISAMKVYENKSLEELRVEQAAFPRIQPENSPCLRMESMKELFLMPSEERNFALIVENQKIWVSKEVLSLASPVFKKMLNDLKTANQNSVELPFKKFADIVELLECLYVFSAQKQITEQNIDAVARMADEYDIKTLKQSCSTFFALKVQSEPNTASVWRILEILVKYRYKDVVKICIPRLATLDIIEIKNHREALPDFITSAILEAKSTRLDKMEHKLDLSLFDLHCSICRNQRYRCLKCGLEICSICTTSPLFCAAFHAEACANKNKVLSQIKKCLCGYEFNDHWLSTL